MPSTMWIQGEAVVPDSRFRVPVPGLDPVVPLTGCGVWPGAQAKGMTTMELPATGRYYQWMRKELKS